MCPGQDVELLTAEAGFVVKTKKKETGEKVFINVCKAEKVKVATSKPVTQNGQRGSTWEVPYRCECSLVAGLHTPAC